MKRHRGGYALPCAGLALILAGAGTGPDPTVALWPFDEQKGVYPSSVLSDVSANNFPLVLGPGGQIVEGKFGNALEPLNQPPVLQVGLLDQSGQSIDGFGPDDCVYISGNFIETEVEWLRRGKDLSKLQGRPVQVVFRMRGAGLYSFQFVKR